MLARLRHLRRNERGMSLIFVGNQTCIAFAPRHRALNMHCDVIPGTWVSPVERDSASGTKIIWASSIGSTRPNFESKS